MYDDRKELFRRLSTLATEVLEDAHEAAIEGQSAELQAQAYARCARRLQRVARELTAVAETMIIVVTPEGDGPANASMARSR